MDVVIDGEAGAIDDRLAAHFLYGFGIYSSFVVQDGRVRSWGRHMERLSRDAAFLGLTLEAGAVAGSVRRFLHGLDGDAPVTCRVTISPAGFDLSSPQAPRRPQILVAGQSGSSVPDHALDLCLVNCPRPNAAHKVTNILAAMHARGCAKAAGRDDAMFTDGGNLTEGPTWNLFVIGADERVRTPRADGRLLPGIARAEVSDILGDACTEAAMTSDALVDAVGAFVTNAVIGAVPVRRIGDHVLDPHHPIISEVKIAYDAVSLEPVI